MNKNNQIDEIINDFNLVLNELVVNLADVCPNSIIGKNIKDIKNVLNSSEYKTKFISIFVERVLQYKPEIDKGKDSFFLGKSYDNDLKGYESYANNIFEFKNIWNELKQDNKNVVIQYMQILCDYAQQYFLLIDE